MKAKKSVFLSLFALLVLPLSACQENSLYGVYAFQMGSVKDTYFRVALALKKATKTNSSNISKHLLTFDYFNVVKNASSSTETSSTASNVSSTSSSASASGGTATLMGLLAEVAGTSSSSASSESIATSSAVSSSDEVTSSSGEATPADTEMHLTGMWEMGDKGVLETELYFVYTDEQGKETEASIPSEITDLLLKITIEGKYANIEIPVSVNDAIDRVMAILNGDDPSTFKFHTVTIALTKEASDL
jgi:hypothetical protein